MSETDCTSRRILYPTEPLVGVQAGGLLVDRVDDDESRRHPLNHDDHSSESLGEERAADALVLTGFVRRQPSEPCAESRRRPRAREVICRGRVVRSETHQAGALPHVRTIDGTWAVPVAAQPEQRLD